MSWGGEYLNVCREAAQNGDNFNAFKSNSHYRCILEHCSYAQGKEHFEIIKNQTPELLECLDKFSINDKYGSPICYEFSGRQFSPTTIQYMKVLSDLIKNFSVEKLNGLRVLELGVGYGGQYVVLSEWLNFESYTFVDLPEVIDLTRAYLTKLGKVTDGLQFIKHSDNVINQLGEYDLVISNFAFSELTKDLQMKYIPEFNKIPAGYLHCNQMSDEQYNKDELCDLIEHDKWCIGDIPSEAKNNYIMMWKDTK